MSAGNGARPGAEGGLLRVMGTVAVAAGIINITVGGGIFRLPSSVAGQLGASAPAAYLVCALAMALVVLCFAEAGSRVELTGGPYAYVEVAFGPFVGFLTGAMLWVVGTLALAAVATILADSVGGLAPGLAGPAARTLILIGSFAALAAVNIRGVRNGSRLNVVLTVAKLAPLLLLAVAGAFHIEPANFRAAAGLEPAALARTSTLLIFAFAGIESALVPSGEIRDNARTVPRALAVAMITVTALYLVLQVVAQGILGAGLAGQATPLAEAAGRAFGPSGRTLLLLGAAVSMLGYVGGMILAVPRVLYAFGRDGFLPPLVGRVHERYRTPHVAIAVQAVICCALALTNGFERLAILANLTTLLVYAACCAAVLELRRKRVEARGRPYRIPGGRSVPFAALLAIAWLLTSITWQEWLVALAVMAVATLAFWLERGRRLAAGNAGAGA